MRKKRDLKSQHAYQMEQDWLREYSLFYGTTSVTRFSEDDLNGVPLVHILEALANVRRIRCDKCDGPGTVCEIESVVGDKQVVQVTVHFDANHMTVSIREAKEVKGSEEDEPNRAA